jgi:hypothetical protein
MKNLFLSLGLLIAAHNALACSNPEAQFIGKVVNHQESAAQGCTYNIDFSLYNESGVCPLDLQDAARTTFVDAACSLENGKTVSGYLVVKDDQIVVE